MRATAFRHGTIHRWLAGFLTLGLLLGAPTAGWASHGPLVTFVVTTAGDTDDGLCDAAGCSLREAIHAANATSDHPAIRFDLPDGSGPIRPTTALPAIDGPADVDGRPIAGDLTPVDVVIAGDLAGAAANGLALGSEVTVQGLEIRDFDGSGIRITGADNLVGGTAAGDGNRIIDNGADGVGVIDLDTARRNAILGNFIADNGRLSINLGEHEATLPGVGYPVSPIAGQPGPNEHTLVPTMDPALPGDTSASGVYYGYSGRTYRIEVFRSDHCSELRFAAQELIGSASVTMPTVSTPPIPFSVPVPDGLAAGFLSATATDQLGNTSEVGPCTRVADPFDLSLESLTVDPALTSLSRTVTVTALARNLGPSTATGYIVAMAWSSGLVDVVTPPTLVGCDAPEDDGTIVIVWCHPASLAVGDTLTLAIELLPVVEGEITVEAFAGILGGDLDDSNSFGSVPFTVAPATPTPTGASVAVSPVDPLTAESPVEMSFANVTGAGVTTLEISSSGPAVPTGFKMGDPPSYYDLETTATFTGVVEICISYDGAAFADEGALRLFHYDDDLDAWQDVTSSHDLLADRICGQTTSLSPFAIVERAFTFSGFFAPVDGDDVLNRVKAGSAIPVKFSLGGDQGLEVFAPGAPSVEPIACPETSIDAIETTVQGSANGLSYDPTSDRYTYVWKSNKGWAGSCRELVLTFSDGSEERARFWFTK